MLREKKCTRKADCIQEYIPSDWIIVGFQMEVLNSEVEMQSEDHTNDLKLYYWQHYKTKIYIIIWLCLFAVAYIHIWNNILPRKPLFDW
jgi:hypothetical protein